MNDKLDNALKSCSITIEDLLEHKDIKKKIKEVQKVAFENGVQDAKNTIQQNLKEHYKDVSMLRRYGFQMSKTNLKKLEAIERLEKYKSAKERTSNDPKQHQLYLPEDWKDNMAEIYELLIEFLKILILKEMLMKTWKNF